MTLQIPMKLWKPQIETQPFYIIIGFAPFLNYLFPINSVPFQKLNLIRNIPSGQVEICQTIPNFPNNAPLVDTSSMSQERVKIKNATEEI